MARNSSGTFSLAAGNPVVSGTTISSTVQNNTLSDIASEMTDSLNRSGKGPMLAPLELTDGSVAAPSLSFDNDVDTGIYRKGANNMALVAGGAEVADIQAAGVDVTGALTVSSTLAVTGTTTLTGAVVTGVTVTQSTANTSAITATGNGTAPGLTVTGGSTGGNGITATAGAGGNGRGVSATGSGNAQGGVFTGGATSGAGISATGGAPNGIGGVFAGTGTAVAINCIGNVSMTGGAPSITTGFTNTLTNANVPKAWGIFASNGTAGAQTLLNGFNITSVSLADNGGIGDFTVTFATAMGSANYVVTYGSTQSGAVNGWTRSGRAAGSFLVALVNMATGTSLSVAGGNNAVVEFVVYGTQ